MKFLFFVKIKTLTFHVFLTCGCVCLNVSFFDRNLTLIHVLCLFLIRLLARPLFVCVFKLDRPYRTFRDVDCGAMSVCVCVCVGLKM